MASQSKSPAEWDFDSDEIASIASEDLHDSRPNRWTGPKSTWRTLTNEERTLWQSMRQLADQDLAVHLYDAFALKKQAGGDPTTAAGLTIKTDDGQDAIWAPPKVWTAWPLNETHLPPEGLFKEQKDEDDQFTFRKQENKMPSSELQDEITATILRFAKDKFRKRMRTRPLQPSIEQPGSLWKQDDSENDSSLPSSPPVALKTESGGDDADSDTDDDEGSSNDEFGDESAVTNTKLKANTTFEPTVSTNDELSQELLRPSVRHILTQLNRTLTALHNSRVAGLSYMSDSDSSTEDESDTAPGSPRKRGRPRRTPQPGEDLSATEQKHIQGPRRRGRPRKVHTPKEGETEEEMHIRIARESHRRLPVSMEDKDAAFEAWLKQGEGKIKRERSRSRSLSKEPAIVGGDPDVTAAAERNIEKKLRRWGLRDWSDVLGAAALGGFSDEVIARTTRRCANLFGQGMVMRRLNEVPASRGAGFVSTEYRPEMIYLPGSNESDADSDEDNLHEQHVAATLSQRRIASRQASLARSSQHASAESSPAPRLGRGRDTARSSRSGSQSRSRSRSSAGFLFCPVLSCDRAATGFSRRANLRRHMHLVHPGHGSEEDDTDDEVVGAVHVDGFLKTINPSRGWRGEDVNARKRKRFYGQRAVERHEKRSDEGEDEVSS